MEKIQSAIAKARAAREGEAPPRPRETGGGPGGPGAAGPPLPPVDADRAWAALPEAQLRPRHLRRHRIVTLEGGAQAAYFDLLRTRVLQQARAQGWRRIAITSPGPGCGKTTTAANLGFSLGRQPESRTILCEVDFRRPALARLLGLRVAQDFAAVLAGTAAFEDQTLRHGPNLAFSTAGARVRHPAELLQGSAAGAALDGIAARYAPTIMLFDMPPMLVSDDVLAFLGRVDAAIIVAAGEQTTVKEIDRCEQEIAALTNVMGVVLNKCRYMDEDYGYSYYS